MSTYRQHNNIGEFLVAMIKSEYYVSTPSCGVGLTILFFFLTLLLVWYVHKILHVVLLIAKLIIHDYA